jgi:Amt family ammonium transporter
MAAYPYEEEAMRRTRLMLAALGALAAVLVVPAAALADGNTLELFNQNKLPPATAINSIWVLVAGILVMFMQAGFAFLEIGFSRGKNAGTVVAKILVNFSIAALMFYAVGMAFAFGEGNSIIGTHGFFLAGTDAGANFPLINLKDGSITVETLWFFQFVFCAVSLAIVWGTTLERIKFGVYIIYSIVFAALIYPIGAHWIFGGGWLAASVGMQDFAGSTVVHLIGASGAFAALLLLGARRGKYGADRKPRAIPGHSMPLFGLGILILWLGWFGFNPGSGLKALDGRFPEIAMVTNLAAAAGVLTAVATMYFWKTKKIDIGMAGNGAIAALVAITAPSGYVELWAAPIIGGVAGVIVVVGCGHDRQVDRRPGGRALGPRPRRHLGHARVRPVHVATAGRVQRGRRSGPGLLGLLPPARRPGAGDRRRVHVRLHVLVRHVLGDQEDIRHARHGRGRGRRPGHRRARHVRVSRAVHPRA